MASASQEFEEDELLAAFNTDQEYDYENELGTQIPIDMGEIEESESTAMSADLADHNVPENFVMEDLPKNTSTEMLPRLHDNEDVVDAEGYSPDTADLRTPNKITGGSTTLGHIPTDIIKLEDEDSDVEILWPDLENHVIDITDSDDDQDVINVDEDARVHVKKEPLEVPFQWTDMGQRTIDLSESDAESGQGTNVKTEGSDASSLWTPMTEHSIEVQDSDLEEGVNLPPLNQKLPEVSQTVHLGTSALRNQGPSVRIDISRLREVQQKYAAKNRQEAIVTGAGSIFSEPRSQPGKADGEVGISASGLNLDGDEAELFRALKANYKAKKKAGKISEEDEILFIIAEKEEKARCKKVMAEYYKASGLEGSEDDEDEPGVDDDAHTFAPRFVGSSSNAKRRRATVEEADSDDAASDIGDESVVGKRPKTDKADKNAYQKEFKIEEHWNMMTGCEQMIYDEKKKQEREEKRAEKESAKSQKRGKKRSEKISALGTKAASKVQKTLPAKKKRSKPKVLKPNPNKEGYLNDLSSLTSSNVYDDANANLGQKQLAISSATRKKDALAGLLVGVHNDDLPSAQREKNHLDRSLKLLGKRKVKADGQGGWILKGMVASLRPYQVQGSAWMKGREIGEVPPRGGLLADEMGLGKTVMAIAAMTANRPTPESEARCTLIVASSALVTQWMSELEVHLEPRTFPNVYRYCGSSRIAGLGAVYNMQSADIVLTTYQELKASYPKCEPPEELQTLEEKKTWWFRMWDQFRGPLHRVFFHRLILDEAQAIKNHLTQTSIACRAVMARHRWAISGTPIQNRVSELYPFFRYLRVEHSGSFEVFKQNFCLEDNDDCTDRLHAYLRQFMIRRTHKSRFLGAPLVTLPENKQRTFTVEFSELEHTLYKAVRDRFAADINVYSFEGTLEKKSKAILTMCLRLRQLTAHPFLIQDTIQDLFGLEDIEKLWIQSGPKADETARRGKDMYSAMRKMIEDKEQNHEDAQTTNEEPPHTGTENVENQHEPGLVLRFRKYLRSFRKSGQWIDLKDRSLCHRCNCPPDEPWVTNCFHLYCKECLNNMAYEAGKEGKSQSWCIPCDKPFEESKPCSGIEELEMDDIVQKTDSDDKIKPGRGKGQNNAERWLDLKGDVLQSSKTTAVKIQLEEWLKEEPDKKVIVFSQFRLLMKIVARICEQQRWGYCNYHGGMSHEGRDESLAEFKEDANKKVLIASLKCGGEGLNLTMASKVICVDLWWNDCAEKQAFCRVLRIGQTSETYITRFVVKDTIDEYLVEMQKEKRKHIGRAMDDNKMLRQLPIRDLMRLFGPVREDSEGRAFILAENDELGSIEPPKEKQQIKKAKKPAIKAPKGRKGNKSSGPAKKPSRKSQPDPPEIVPADSEAEEDLFFS